MADDLLKIIDAQQNSLRLYRLASNREEVVVVHGRDKYRDLSGPLII